MAGTMPLARTTSAAQGFVSLVDVDPELTDGIPPGDHPLARRALARATQPLPDDVTGVEALLAADGVFGLLIVDGAVVRELEVAGRRCTEILGPGDVIGGIDANALTPFPVTWKTLQRASVFALDGRFVAAAQKWPSLTVNLYRRLLEQGHRSAIHAAIAQLPRVERRVLALMWQLAERWGRMTPFGVEIGVALTHEALGRLVGAQRPTVTLALADLARDGALSRTTRRTWLLSNESRELVRPEPATPRRSATA